MTSPLEGENVSNFAQFFHFSQAGCSFPSGRQPVPWCCTCGSMGPFFLAALRCSPFSRPSSKPKRIFFPSLFRVKSLNERIQQDIQGKKKEQTTTAPDFLPVSIRPQRDSCILFYTPHCPAEQPMASWKEIQVFVSKYEFH